MAINALALFLEARNLYGYAGTLADVQAALSAVDRSPLEAAERAKYFITIWDEVSDLAGQSPEYWRNRGDWPYDKGGKFFLIYMNGLLQIVQPHDPDASGHSPMTEEVALARAEAMVSAQVTGIVDAMVKERVLIQLLS